MSSVPAVWRLAHRIARPPSRSLARAGVRRLGAALGDALGGRCRSGPGRPKVFNAYGITETGSWLAGTTVAGFKPEDGLVGEAVGRRRSASSSDDEPGRRSDPDRRAARRAKLGHVWVKTPALMRGYLDRDDLTERRSSATAGSSPATSGSLDERGWLYLRGRERDEINKGGMKVYPAGHRQPSSSAFRRPPTSAPSRFAEPLLGEDVGVAVVLQRRGARHCSGAARLDGRAPRASIRSRNAGTCCRRSREPLAAR